MSRVEIRWVGTDHARNKKRVWGYLVEIDNPWKQCTTFWGRKGGKIYFQNTRMDKEFQKNLKRKRERYVQESDLEPSVLFEYEQVQIMKKLKGA